MHLGLPICLSASLLNESRHSQGLQDIWGKPLRWTTETKPDKLEKRHLVEEEKHRKQKKTSKIQEDIESIKKK